MFYPHKKNQWKNFA